MIEVRPPEELFETMPSSKAGMVQHLLPSIEETISEYEKSLRRRVPGALGGALDRHEKSILRDFLLDRILRNALAEEPTVDAVSAPSPH